MQENWINKIIEHQTVPPIAVWDNIASELDETDEHLHTVKQKILAYETTAPEIVFKNVFGELDKEEGKIYPIAKKRQSRPVVFIRMAVAASVITIAILLFFNNKKTADKAGVVATTVSKPAIEQPQPDIAAADSLPVAVASKKNAEQNITGITVQKTNPQQAAVNYARAKDIVTGYSNNSATLQSTQQLMPVSSKLINALNRYITITGPGGESVKLSSKFGSMPGILNNGNTGTATDNIDAIINESSKWSNAFAGWRDKMAGNVITPSLINFLDIIELSEFLEEKKQTISRLDLRYLNLY